MVAYDNKVVSEVIDRYIHSQRNREILKSRLIDGLTYDELSEKYHMSVRGIKYVVYREQDKLFLHLT